MGYHFGQFGRCQPMCKFNHIRARDIHIHKHARHLKGWNGHRRFCRSNVNMMTGNEHIDHIKISLCHTVHCSYAPTYNLNTRLWIARTRHSRKPVFRIINGKVIQSQRSIIPLRKPPPTVRCDWQWLVHDIS